MPDDWTIAAGSDLPGTETGLIWGGNGLGDGYAKWVWKMDGEMDREMDGKMDTGMGCK